jgi:hypothetical protein
MNVRIILVLRRNDTFLDKPCVGEHKTPMETGDP